VSDDIDDVMRRADEGPRIVTIDLERVPGRTAERDIWDPRDAKRWNYWPPEEWVSLPRTVCFTAKTMGKRPEFVAEWQRPDPHWIARRSWEIVDAADLVVTYNGNRADLAWLRTAWLDAGLPEPRPFKSVDLFKLQARWALERRSLAYLLERLSMASKEGHYNAAEARAACAGNRAAQKALRGYNMTDVEITEALYLRVRHLLPTVNLGAFYADAEDVNRCPYCGAEGTLKASGWYTASVQSYGLLTCDSCGGHARNNHVKRKTRVRGVRS
jgi:hypothetical protein